MRKTKDTDWLENGQRFENHIGFWNWQGGQVVYRALKAPYALGSSPPPKIPRSIGYGAIALEVGLALVYISSVT